MYKDDEVSSPSSCLNKSAPHEMLFVLTARDRCAPSVIQFWIQSRVRSGKNKMTDPQIVEAGECARIMEAQRKLMDRETPAPSCCEKCKQPMTRSRLFEAWVCENSKCKMCGILRHIPKPVRS